MKQELSHALHTFEDSVTGLSNTKPLSHAMSVRSEYHYVPVDDRAAAWGFYLWVSTSPLTGRGLPVVALIIHPGSSAALRQFGCS